MPRAAYGQNVIPLFDGARFPSGRPSPREAGLGIQQVLLWYEPVGMVPPGTLHIYDANALATPSWQARARAAEQWLASELGVAQAAVPGMVNTFMGQPQRAGQQAQNPRGSGYRSLIAECLERWAAPGLEVHEEEPARNWFAVASLGQARDAKADVLIERGGVPKAFISCKWALRNDRNHDVVNEGNQYKSAAAGRGMTVEVGLVTNEFGPGRIARVLDSQLVDFVAHTNRDLFFAMPWTRSPDFGALASNPRFIDLYDLIVRAQTW